MTKNKISDLENELIKEATTIVKNDEKVLTLPFLQQAYDVYFNSSKYLIDKEVNELTRYSSWDICYKFFQENPKDSNLRIAGLHLGFYLASWGMFRNPTLLNSGIKKYELLAGKVYDLKNDHLEVQRKEIKAFLKEWKKDVKEILGRSTKKDDPTDTLVTKIMLGVYSNTPAFDRFFKKTVSRFCDLEKNLTLEKKIENIVKTRTNDKNQEVGDFIKSRSQTPSDKFYEKDIKILDAVFFQIGSALDKAETTLGIKKTKKSD